MNVSDGQRSHEDRAWENPPVERGDRGDVKRLFLKLHLYNTSLDPRFALAEGWERHVDALIGRHTAAQPRLALLARNRISGHPAGFILASVHRDVPLWRHREWAEVEALYVERAWWGSGLADALLDHALTWAAELGQPVVQLYVTASNARALRFYARHGFRPAQAILRTMLPAE